MNGVNWSRILIEKKNVLTNASTIVALILVFGYFAWMHYTTVNLWIAYVWIPFFGMILGLS